MKYTNNHNKKNNNNGNLFDFEKTVAKISCVLNL